MGRQRLLWSLAVVAVGLFARAAHAEIQDTTSSLKGGEWGLAAEFEAALEPDVPLSIILHQNVGIVGGLDIFAREGIALNNRNYYLGAGVKWTILHDKPRAPGLAVWAGGHYWFDNYAGINLAIMVDHRFDWARPYAGLLYDMDFTGDALHHKLRLLLGCRFAIVNHFAWFVEGGVGLAQPPLPHFVSTGPRFTI